MGQVSDLTHTSRKLLEHSPGSENEGAICTLSSRHYRITVSLRSELLQVSGAQIFAAPLCREHLYIAGVWWPDWLMLVGPIELLTSEERGLQRLPLPGHSNRQQTLELSPSEIDAY